MLPAQRMAAGLMSPGIKGERSFVSFWGDQGRRRKWNPFKAIKGWTLLGHNTKEKFQTDEVNICVVLGSSLGSVAHTLSLSHHWWIRGPTAAFLLRSVVCLEVPFKDLIARAGVLAL